MSVITNKIINFIKDSPVEHITAASVMYKIMEDIPTIQENELLELLKNIIQIIKNDIENNSELFKRLSNIPKQVNYLIFKIFLIFILNDDGAIP